MIRFFRVSTSRKRLWSCVRVFNPPQSATTTALENRRRNRNGFAGWSIWFDWPEKKNEKRKKENKKKLSCYIGLVSVLAGPSRSWVLVADIALRVTCARLTCWWIRNSKHTKFKKSKNKWMKAIKLIGWLAIVKIVKLFTAPVRWLSFLFCDLSWRWE